MMNFRRLKQDFSPNIVKDGKLLFEKDAVISAKIIQLSGHSVKVSSRVEGTYENSYECEIEIDRQESCIVDSNCDCPYTYDCQHLAALLFHLEGHFDQILVEYSKENDLEKSAGIAEEDKEEIRATIKEAESKEVVRRGKQCQKELLEEYVGASRVLGGSPFFVPDEHSEPDSAGLAIVFSQNAEVAGMYDVQLALRLPYRSKPLNVPNIRDFLDAICYREPIYISGKRYFFVQESFDAENQRILKQIQFHIRFQENKNGERNQRSGTMDSESFGMLLAEAYHISVVKIPPRLQ